MFRSVRSRLTWWYTGILALVLGVFSLVVYTKLSQDSYGDVDATLNSAVDVLSRSLRHEIEEHQGKGPGEEAFQGVATTVYNDAFPDVGVAIVEGGRTIAEKPALGGRTPTIPPQPVSGFRTEGDWRFKTLNMPVPNAGVYTFVAGTLLTPVQGEMAELRGVFYTSIPAALALAAFGGYLLARKSLAPVVAMSTAAEKISTQNLSERVAIANEHDELGTLGLTFNHLLDRMERAFDSQRRFMADSSHELQTPIYVARTATDVILSTGGRSETEYQEALTTIQQQLRRLSHIVDGMFMLAQADAGAHPVRKEDFYLDEVIAESLRAARVLGEPKKIQVVGPELTEMPFHGDEGLIRQLLIILLDNAVKYTAEGGQVELRLAPGETGRYTLDVIDTGPGIPGESREKIFSRFFRVDRTASRGAGLGLAIADWIARAHGGTLSLRESSAQGSTFRIEIPGGHGEHLAGV